MQKHIFGKALQLLPVYFVTRFFFCDSSSVGDKVVVLILRNYHILHFIRFVSPDIS